jgi:hypothetical protein
MKKDLSILKITNPAPNKEYHLEYIKADAVNLGREVMNGFNLAYRINNNFPVNEFFNINLNPGDTAHVQFNQQADMSFNGNYLISVYSFNNNDNYALNDTAKVAIINTKSEKIPETDIYKVKIMPNPFSDNLKMSIYSAVPDVIQISILESTGRIVLERNGILMPGENSIEINTTGLSSGIYIIKTNGKQISDAKRIIKIR